MERCLVARPKGSPPWSAALLARPKGSPPWSAALLARRRGRRRGALPCLQGRGEQGDMVYACDFFICTLTRLMRDSDRCSILQARYLSLWPRASIGRRTAQHGKGHYMTHIALFTTASQARQRSTGWRPLRPRKRGSAPRGGDPYGLASEAALHSGGLLVRCSGSSHCPT